MRTTPHLMLEPAFHPGLDTAGSGRDAIGLGAATSGRLDARHGTILSLEDINVSFDGFKALRDLPQDVDYDPNPFLQKAFERIAMAKVAANRGNGTDVDEGRKELVDKLVADLLRGTGGDDHWSSIALGVYGFLLDEAGETPAASLG